MEGIKRKDSTKAFDTFNKNMKGYLGLGSCSSESAPTEARVVFPIPKSVGILSTLGLWPFLQCPDSVPWMSGLHTEAASAGALSFLVEISQGVTWDMANTPGSS